MSEQGLFDPGLQPERTLLSWRRTLLALAAGSLVALRLLPPALGTWAVALGLAGLLFSVVLWPLATRRSTIAYRALLRGSEPLPGGGLLLVLAAVVAAGGMLGLLWTVLPSP